MLNTNEINMRESFPGLRFPRWTIETSKQNMDIIQMWGGWIATKGKCVWSSIIYKRKNLVLCNVHDARQLLKSLLILGTITVAEVNVVTGTIIAREKAMEVDRDTRTLRMLRSRYGSRMSALRK